MIMPEVFAPNDMRSHIRFIATNYALGLSSTPPQHHGSRVKFGRRLRDTLPSV